MVAIYLSRIILIKTSIRNKIIQGFKFIFIFLFNYRLWRKLKSNIIENLLKINEVNFKITEKYNY